MSITHHRAVEPRPSSTGEQLDSPPPSPPQAAAHLPLLVAICCETTRGNPRVFLQLCSFDFGVVSLNLGWQHGHRLIKPGWMGFRTSLVQPPPASSDGHIGALSKMLLNPPGSSTSAKHLSPSLAIPSMSPKHHLHPLSTQTQVGPKPSLANPHDEREGAAAVPGLPNPDS